MTVAELIEYLTKVEDKSQVVTIQACGVTGQGFYTYPVELKPINLPKIGEAINICPDFNKPYLR